MIKFKLTKNRIILLCGFLVLIVSLLIYSSYLSSLPKPIHSVVVNGKTINFRADLRKADKIRVYPSENKLYVELMRPLVKNITIAFKPVDEKENPYYILQIIELIPKLSFAYLKEGLEPYFNEEPLVVDSYDNITTTTYSPIIALVHPVYSNETAIRVKNHVIYLEAKNYEDFDLVTAKLLIVVLELKLNQQ